MTSGCTRRGVEKSGTDPQTGSLDTARTPGKTGPNNGSAYATSASERKPSAKCVRHVGVSGLSYPRASERNSSRVAFCERKLPIMVLVMVPECCFSTPRIIMQK